MSRFLFAWELGGGLGHIGHLVPAAQALRQAGHHVALALRDLRTLGSLDPGPDIPVLQAPVCAHTYEGLVDPPLNYAEVLMRFGYVDVPMLTGLIRAWRALAQATGAEVMVADHAPSAVLAAKTLGLRCVVMGNAFTVPPLMSPTPNMRPWLQVEPARLQASDKSVLDTINASLRHFGAPPLAHVHELFAVDDIVITNFRELDHYGQRGAADLARLTYCGPVAARGARSVAPPWPGAAGVGKRIFAYLKPDYSHLGAILAALAASAQPCVIYGLGSGSALAPFAANLVYSVQPVDVDVAGRECALAVCHGSGITADLLQAGRPQLLLPMQLEQFLGGLRVAELGAGLLVNPEEKQPAVGNALQRLLDEAQFSERAGAFAARYRDWSADRIIANVAARLASVAAGVRLDSAGTAK